MRKSIVGLAIATVLVGCGPTARTDASCSAAFAKWADYVDQAVADKVDWLPELVRACGTTDQWRSAAAAYPKALLSGDPARLLDIGCTKPDVGDEPLCRDNRP